MRKKTMLAGCLAALALAALPGVAAAEETSNPGGPYLEGVSEGTQFSVEGALPEASTVGGRFVNCLSGPTP